MIEWQMAKGVIGTDTLTLGPQAAAQWLRQPDHLAFVLFRYRAAAALIGQALSVLEIGSGEGIGAGILARNREMYVGIDADADGIAHAERVNGQRDLRDRKRISFGHADAITMRDDTAIGFDAVVSLDVIEHIPHDEESMFLDRIVSHLAPQGVCVLGTPSAYAEPYASPQSRIGHVNLFTPERLQKTMSERFHVVQMLYTQDTAFHLGRPEMAHYLFGVGVMPR